MLQPLGTALGAGCAPGSSFKLDGLEIRKVGGSRSVTVGWGEKLPAAS